MKYALALTLACFLSTACYAQTTVNPATGSTTKIINGGTGATTATAALANLNGLRNFPTKRVPSQTDDSASGYSTGQFWSFNNNYYTATAVSPGFANWQIQGYKPSATLCDLVTTCKAAYGTFKLLGAYAGSSFQVTRASDSTTKDIGFDGNGVAKWTDVDTFCAGTSCGVSVLYDQSGNGYDLAQATLANMPKILGWSVGNLRAISLAGSATMINTALPISNIQNMALFSIQRNDVSGGISGNQWYELGSPTIKWSLGAAQGPDFRGISQYANGSLFSVTTMIETNDEVTLLVNTAGASSISQNNKKASYSGTIASGAPVGLRMGTSSVNSNLGKFDLAALVIYDSTLSSANQQLLTQAAYQVSGIKPQAADNLLFVGDSITEGVVSGTYGYGYNYTMQLTTSFDHPLNYFNVGFFGQTLASMLPNASTYANLVKTTGARNIVTIFAGTNDFAGSSLVTAASVYANMQTICGTYKAAGFSCVVASPLPRNGLFSGGSDATNFESRRQTLEGLLVAGWPTFADGFIDLVADPVIGPQAAASNAALFPDAVHPSSPLCNSYLAAAFARGLKTLLQ